MDRFCHTRMQAELGSAGIGVDARPHMAVAAAIVGTRTAFDVH
jgi:hypothetical protein